MFNAQECRANACAELASRAPDADRAIWVKIAYGWLEVAVEIERDAEADPASVLVSAAARQRPAWPGAGA
jgi:hypothetical protein